MGPSSSFSKYMVKIETSIGLYPVECDAGDDTGDDAGDDVGEDVGDDADADGVSKCSVFGQCGLPVVYGTTYSRQLVVRRCNSLSTCNLQRVTAWRC